MNIKDILTELGQQMGLGKLKLDDNRVCRLVFDRKFTVDIEATHDEKIVHIYAAVCIIPPFNKEKLYETILDSNPFGRGTGGAIFGIDLEMGEILMTRTLVMEKIDYQDFVNILESFVNHLEAWTEKIDKEDYIKGPTKSPRKELSGLPSDDEDEDDKDDDDEDDGKNNPSFDSGFIKA